MRKILTVTLAVIFALTLIGCGDGSNNNNNNNNDNNNNNNNNDNNSGNNTYKIGDTGPGSGIIFFAEGGQYKECSGELGNNTWAEAVSTANNFAGGGFSDWSLPDRSELDLMFRNLKQKGLGGFQNSWYWSSVTEIGYISFAWARDFSTGSEYSYNKTSNLLGVRAVRSFTMEQVNDTGTTLTIKNESAIEITEVIWNNVSFTTSDETIKTGTNISKSVQPGSAYLYFKQKGSTIAVRTDDLVTVTENEKAEVVLTNNKVILEISDTNTKEPMGTFFTKPWIVIKQGTDVKELYGEHDLGSVLVNNYKDITFTIENIGGGILTLESISANRVTLDENASGFFAVTQQPLATSVQPGNSTSFTIRFTPTTISTNNTASVHIKTNAKNVEEFAFRVKGAGRIYIIGDTGPGGGTVFYAQGNQFKECSGELGTYNWTNAVTTASSYRGNNFSDWALPDRGELDLMYRNLFRATPSLGGFISGGTYWSSDVYSGGSSYYFYFGSTGSSQNYDYNSYAYRVRAVRSFSL